MSARPLALTGWTEPQRSIERELEVRSAIKGVMAMYHAGLVAEHDARAILSKVLLWNYTERSGKWNLRYISKGVWDDPVHRAHHFNHEHVQPRAYAIRRLFDGEDVDTVIKDMEACIVTREEHALLKPFDHLFKWERYRQAGVHVWDRERGEWLWSTIYQD